MEIFLKNKTQFFSINCKSLEKSPVTSGLPQGSVQGSALFIGFINDLPVEVECNLNILADDAKAYANINSAEDQMMLQKCMDKLVEWGAKWLLKFNSDKCNTLHIGNNNPKYSYIKISHACS